MRPIKLAIYKLNIPFVEAFSHSAKNRSFSDSFIAEVTLDDGTVGYGEGIARPYVTGEQVDTAVNYLSTVLWPVLYNRNISGIHPLDFVSLFPNPEEGGVVFHGAQAAMEVALLDASLRLKGQGVCDLLPPKLKSIRYSGVISASSSESIVKAAKKYRVFGITEFKLKVERERFAEQIEVVRKTIGPDCLLRIDGNFAFDADSLVELDLVCQQFKVDIIEQPTKRLPAADWGKLQSSISTALMPDESLITEQDAHELIAAKSCRVFNLRIAKCGGIARTLKLANLAHAHNIPYQLGCQVGETCVLSSVGRALAAFLANCVHVEGSFGNLLLTEDLCRDRYQFGHGGFAAVTKGVGIGVELEPEKIKKFTTESIFL